MAADAVAGLIVAASHSTRSFIGVLPTASLPRLVFPLRWVVTPFAGSRIVAGVILLTLLGARVIGAAEFRAAVAHASRRIRVTLRQRRRSSRR
jgi:hypothetical protein